LPLWLHKKFGKEKKRKFFLIKKILCPWQATGALSIHLGAMAVN
jgi:hypothetical protein